MVKLAALFSGGKDSTYAVYIAQQMGWEVDCLVTIIPRQDSYLYHVPNVEWTSLSSQALGIPLVKHHSEGGEEAELKALREALSSLKVDGVLTGAVASEYQHSRINQICHELGLRVFSPLWRKNPEALINDYIDAGFCIMIVGVYAEGFNERWLGRVLDISALEELVELRRTKGINISGEGGEFETMVLDGPNFKNRIVVDDAERSWRDSSGSLIIKRAHLSPK